MISYEILHRDFTADLHTFILSHFPDISEEYDQMKETCSLFCDTNLKPHHSFWISAFNATELRRVDYYNSKL